MLNYRHKALDLVHKLVLSLVVVGMTFSNFAPLAALVSFSSIPVAEAAFNKQVNYQGKLTLPSNVAVADGTYSMRFKLYTTATGGAPIWTETWCDTSTCDGLGSGTDDRIRLISGLFSTMLGSTTPFGNIDWNQTLYLGVEIGGSDAAAVWDSEMAPRKRLGAVPAAFVAESANTLQGLNSAEFLRSDAANSTSTATTYVSILQSGAGKIAEFFGVATRSVLSLLSGGNVGIGSSTPSANLSVAGSAGQTQNILAISTTTAGFATSTAIVVDSNGKMGIGSSTPYAQLSVAGLAAASIFNADNAGATSTFAGGLNVNLLNVLSSTATSSFANGINLNKGCFAVGGVCVGTGSGNGTVTLGTQGQIAFYNADGTAVSGTSTITITQNGKVGIGTTSPWAALGVEGISTLGNQAIAGYFTATSSTASTFSNVTVSGLGDFGSVTTDNLTVNGLTGASIRCLQVNPDGSVAANASACGSGGSTAGGTWATTTSNVLGQLINYSNLTTDIVAIGNTATTTAKFWFDPNIQTAYFSGKLGVGTTSPYAQLSIEGVSVLGNSATAGFFTATTSQASIFPYASTTAITAITASTTNLIVSGLGGASTRCLQVNSDGSVSANSASCGTGGSVSSWATSTAFGTTLNNYSLNNTDVVEIGGSSTSTAKMFFDPNALMSFLSGRLGVGTSTPWGTLSVNATSSTLAPYFAISSTTNGITQTLMVLDRNGRLGLGTTSPSEELTVQNGNIGLNTGYINFTPNVLDETLTFALKGRTDAGLPAAVPYFVPMGTSTDGRVAFDLLVKGNPTDRANVGVAWMDICDSNEAAVILGNFECTRFGKFKNGAAYLSAAAGGTGTVRNLLLQTYGGNVGIGTTTPTGILTVYNSAAATTGGSEVLRLGAVDASATIGSGPVINFVNQNDTILGSIASPIESSGNVGLTFSTFNGSNTEKLRITAAGKVGIGTSTPFSKLSVVASSTQGVSYFVVASSTNGNTYQNLFLVASSTGFVGIGATTTPGSLLSLNGVANFGAATSSFYTTGGINITGGCFALNGLCFSNATSSGYVNAGTQGQIAFYNAAGTAVFATSSLFIAQNGNIGVGTTSPWGTLSVTASSSVSAPYFTVASTTNGTSTTLMILDSNGFLGLGTTTPGSLLSLGGIANFTTASTSFYGTGGINLTAGCFAIGGTCLAVSTSSGIVNSGLQGQLPFYNANGNTLTATSSIFLSQSGKIGIGSTSPWGTLSVTASSSVSAPYFTVASTTNGTSTTLMLLDRNGFLGVGTTTPGSQISVGGVANFGTATSSLYGTGGINIAAGCFAIAGSCIGVAGASGTVSSGQQGQIAFYNAAGTTVSATSSLFIAQNGNIGVGTTTPWGTLSVTASSSVSAPYFTIASTTNGTSTTLMLLDRNGFLGLGTTTPGSLLSLGGIANFGAATSSFYTTGGINLAAGCFALNGTCLVNATSSGYVNAGTQGQIAFYNAAGTTLTATSSLFIAQNGNIGVGTTTPWGTLSVTASSSVSAPYFTVASTTNGTSTTLMLLDRNGFLGLGTTTPGTLLSLQGVANFGTATSSLYGTGGLNIANGCFAVGGTCLAVSTSSGIVNSGLQGQLPFYNANGNTLTATSSIFLSQSGKIGIGSTSPWGTLSVTASSSVSAPYFTVASTTNGTSTTLMLLDRNGFLGLGTTTPGSLLSLGGVANFGAATSSFYTTGGINLAAGCFALNGTCLAVSTSSGIVNTGSQGQISFYNSNGNTLTGTSSLFIAQNGNIGVGTTTPWGTLSVTASSSVSAPYFTIASTTNGTSTTLFVLDRNGNVGIGTTTPGSLLSVGGVANFGTATSSLYGTGGINIAAGCFAIAGSCIGVAGASGTVSAGQQGQISFYNAAGTTLTATSSLFIAQNGNIGVGTTTPWGTLSVTASSSVSAPYFTVASTTNGTSTTLMLLDRNGFLGLSTTTPGSLLSLGGIANFTTATTSFYGTGGINLTAGCYAVGGTCLTVSTSSGIINSGLQGQLPFYNANGNTLTGTSTLFISQSSRVGIASTSPWATFSITASSSVAAPYFALASTTNGTSTTLMILDRTGFLGLGTTTPGSLLSLGSVANFGAATSSFYTTGGINLAAGCYAVNGVCLTNNTATGNVNNGSAGQVTYYSADGVTVSGTSTIFMTPAKNVGVGTSTPYSKLSVWGNDTLSGTRIFELTNSASTSLLYIDDAGSVNIPVTTATTTIGGGLAVSGVGGLNVLNNGNVSIGALNQGVNNKLYVSGTLAVNTGSINTTGYDLYTNTNARFGSITAGSVSASGLQGGAGSGGIINLQNVASDAFSFSSMANTSASNIFTFNAQGSDATKNLFQIQNTSVPVFTISGSNNVGIGTTSPYAALSVVGASGVVADHYTATSTTATSTFAWGIQATLLNITSTTASSTFGNGINLTKGCFAVNDICISGSGGGSGVVNSALQGQLAFYSLANSNTVSGSSVITIGTTTGLTNNIGIGTTSPYATLTIVGQPGQGTPLFALATSSYAKAFFTIASSTGFNLAGGATQPTHAGSIADGVGGAALAQASAVAIANNYAYVVASSSGALEILDITNPIQPKHIGKIADGAGGAALAQANNLVVAGNYAYIVSAGVSALEIVNISNPVSPTHVGKLVSGTNGALMGNPTGIAVSGNYAYIAAQNSNSLEIVDISDPTAPIHRGSIVNGTGGASLLGAYSVFVQGHYAYVTASQGSALEIIDVTNPTAPVHAGKIVDGGVVSLNTPYFVTVRDNTAYVTSGGSNALEIIDVTNPAAPAHKGKITGGGATKLSVPIAVAVAGNYAYIASFTSSALEVVDISSSTSPVHQASISNSTNGAQLNGPSYVALAGNYAYVTGYNGNTLEVVDIGGATISNAEIGTAKIGNLQVANLAQFNNSVSIMAGLNVGSNALIGGTLTVSNNASSTASSSAVTAVFLNGNVGIGSSTPYARLSIDSQSETTSVAADQILNGTFASDLGNWTAGSDWTWSAGVAKSSAVAHNDLTQDVSTIVGEMYKLTYVVANSTNSGLDSVITDGEVSYSLGTDWDGTNSRYFVARNPTVTVGFRATDSGDANITVDNVTVQRVIPYRPAFAINNSLGLPSLEIWTSNSTNTYVGVQSGSRTVSNTSFANTGFGFQALANNNGSSNTAVGHHALLYNTTGASNVAIGVQAMESNLNGQSNVAVGNSALQANISGTNNVAVGLGAMYINISGILNSAFGQSALRSNTSGSNNLAMGSEADYYNVSATNTMAIGYNAAHGTAAYHNQGGTYLGYYSGYSASNNSDYNTFLGYQSGYGDTTGARNIFIGPYSASTTQTGNNNIALGYNIAMPSTNGSNQLNIGNLIFGTGINGEGTNLSTGNIGIGTTTPWGKLSINATSSTAAPYLVLASTTNNTTQTLMLLDRNGYLGVGTTTPGSLLSLGGIANFTSATTSFYGTGGVNLTAGCFSVSGVCLTNSTGTSSGIVASSSQGYVAFYNQFGNTVMGTSSIYVAQSGKVSIATTTSYATLSVASPSEAVTYGSDLIINGGFNSDLSSWTAGSDWSWVSNHAVTSGVSRNKLSQSIAVTNGTIYKITFTVGNSNSFGMDVNVNGSSAYTETGVWDGENTIYFTATSSNNINVYFSAPESLTLDDVSMKPVVATAPSFAILDNSGISTLEMRSGSQSTNTLIGKGSGQYNSGASNTALGYKSLFGNTSGYRNTAIGSQSLYFNLNGVDNTAVGETSLNLNLSGSSNTGIGARSMTNNSIGNLNTAVGVDSLTFNTSGSYNSALGYKALYGNTTGNYNSAFGYNALGGSSVTIGEGNTAMGFQAITYLKYGSNNTAIGLNALGSVVSATSSVAIGAYSGYSNGVSTGTHFASSTFIGAYSGYKISTGDLNTFLGYQSGYNVTSGVNNLFLGVNAASTTATGANNIAIGYDIALPSADGSNQLNIGNLIFGTGINGEGTNLSTGNIGIGTTTPWGKLSINATSSTAAPYLVLASTTNNTTQTLMLLDRNGYLGVGTTTPGSLLSLGGIANFTSATSSFYGTGGINLAVGCFAVSGVCLSSTATISGGTAGMLTSWTSATGLTATSGPTAAYYTATSTTATSTFNGGVSFLGTNGLGINFGSNTKWYQNGQSFLNSSTTSAGNLSIGYQSASQLDASGGLGSTYIGYQSGLSATSSSQNTALGYLTLTNVSRSDAVNMTGSLNTAIGWSALTANTFGQKNTAVGGSALVTNTTGYNNSAFGASSLNSNSTGADSVAVGYSSLYLNNSGNKNTAIGNLALYGNTIGSQNTAVGYQAMATGNQSGSLTGYNNTAMGAYALNQADNASTTTAIGADAGYGQFGYTSIGNTLLGFRSGYSLDTNGNNNLFLGAYAASTTITGANNIAIGYDVGFANTASSNQLNIGNLLFGTGVNGEGTNISTGNIGIGTSTPFAKLSISGTAGQTNPFFAIASTSGAAPFIQVASTSNFQIDGGVIYPVHAGKLINGSGGAALAGAQSVFVSGNYAYVASFTSNALEIVDVSDPKNPVHKGSLADGTGGALLAGASSVFVAGNYAYVAAKTSGALEIVDVSNPAAPVHKGSLSNGVGGARLQGPIAVFVSGGYAYVTDYSGTAMEIVDVSNPARPIHKGAYKNGVNGVSFNQPGGLYVVGNYVYFLASVSLRILDVSDPTNPVEKGRYTRNGSEDFVFPQNIMVQGDYAYTTTNDGHTVSIFNISDPTAPTNVVNYNNGANNGMFGLFVSGNYIYTTSAPGQFVRIFQMTSSSTIALAGSLASSTDPGGASLSSPYSIYVQGNYAYVADYTGNALEVIDVGALNVSNAQIGTLKVANLSVDGFTQFNNNILVKNSLNVGGNTLLDGILTVNGVTGTTTGRFATTSAIFMGNVGIGAMSSGSSSPFARLSVTGSGTGTSYAFAVSDAASTTRFAILDNGTASTTNLIISGLGGASTRCLQVQSDGTIAANASACGSSGGAAGGSWATSTAFGTTLNNYSNNATDVVEIGSVTGTSTAKFWFDPNSQVGYMSGKLGIGTTTPWATLSVEGNSTLGNIAYAGSFIATSTTATSSFAGGVTMGNTFSYDSDSGVTSVGALSVGNLSFEQNAGQVQWADLPIDSTVPQNTAESYTAALNGLPMVTVYGLADGAGNIIGTSSAVGIGSSTPYAKLSVNGNGIGTGWAFAVADIASTTRFVIQDNGNVGIGTTTPGTLLSLGGIANFTTATSSIYSTGGINLAAGCFSIRGTCVGGSSGGNGTVNTGLQGQFAFYDADGTAVNGTSTLFISRAGNIGVGSTSPFANFAIHANNGSTNTTLFAIGSSTQTGTTTLLSVNNLGQLLASDGSTARPSLSFTNMPNTGFYVSPSNFLLIDWNGALVNSITNTSFVFNQSTLTINSPNAVLSFGSDGTVDPSIVRDGSNALAVKNGIWSQTLNIYGTTTNSSNYERLSFQAASSTNGNANTFVSSALGFGTARPFNFTGANVGIGTSSPWAQFAIAATSSVSVNSVPMFVVATSTVTSTSTAFIIDKNGKVGVGTTTPYAQLSVAGTTASGIYNADNRGATSTFAGGFVAAGTSGLTVLQGGNVGIGRVDPATALDVNGTITVGPSTNPILRAGISSDSAGMLLLNSSTANGVTVYGELAPSANGGALGDSTHRWNGFFTSGIFSGSVGIGTTSPWAALSVEGTSTLGNLAIAGYFNATSTSATSTFAGGLIGNGTSIFDNAEIGALTFDTDAGAVSWMDLPFSTTAAANTVESYTAQLNGIAMLTVYGQNDGTGVLKNAAVGIGTTTPFGVLTVAASSTAPAMLIQQVLSTTEGSLLSMYKGSTEVFNVQGVDNGGASAVVGINFNYLLPATSTVSLNKDSWTIASSSSALNPVMDVSFSSTGATSTIGFFVSTTTGLTAGTGTAIPSALKNYVIVGNGKTQAGMGIVNGGLCVDNDGWCEATTTGRIASVSSTVGGSDLAETYISSETLEKGQIVSTISGILINKANQGNSGNILGIVSTDPGLTMGLKPDEEQGQGGRYPIALSGRVPVEVTVEGGDIAVGDPITVSSVPGIGMKASAATTTRVVAIALEPWNAAAIAALGTSTPVKQDVNGRRIGKILAFVNLATRVSQNDLASSTASTADRLALLTSQFGIVSSQVGALNDMIASAGLASSSNDLSGTVAELVASSTAMSATIANLVANLASSTAANTVTAIIASSTALSALASSTADWLLGVGVGGAASGVASSTASTSPSTFVSRVAEAVSNLIATAGNWMIDRLTARVVYTGRIETAVAAVSKGLEMTDSATGQIYCVSIKNGDWSKVQGTCSTDAPVPDPSQNATSSDASQLAHPIIDPATSTPVIATTTVDVTPTASSTPDTSSDPVPSSGANSATSSSDAAPIVPAAPAASAPLPSDSPAPPAPAAPAPAAPAASAPAADPAPAPAAPAPSDGGSAAQ